MKPPPLPPELPQVMINHPNYRDGVQTKMKEVVFSMMMPGKLSAAMGDMICWMTAIKYVADNYNYVFGHLIVPYWFIEVAANIMRPYPNWRVHTQIPERIKDGTQLRTPHEIPANAVGFHLMDLGFVYFLQFQKAPEDAKFYVELNLTDVQFSKWIPRGRYAVVTPGTTAITRMMTPDAFNGICKHLRANKIEPVFLGVDSMDKGERPVVVHDAYDLSLGTNLIGQTTLMEAAKIMEYAEMVIGIDNGLLHLAAMTDVTILYGYTVAGPNQRRVFRKYGNTIEMYADPAKVKCLFCQEHVRFFQDHYFTTCLYKEYEPLCVKALNKESWCAAIDQVIKEKDT